VAGRRHKKDFTRLIEALLQWLNRVVIIDGWAHRLSRLHPVARPLAYERLATFVGRRSRRRMEARSTKAS
jgi:hypothetical protein